MGVGQYQLQRKCLKLRVGVGEEALVLFVAMASKHYQLSVATGQGG